MKVSAYFLILVIFLSGVTASFNSDLDDCEGNVRCVFRIAAKYDDKEACNSLDDYMVDSCQDYIEGAGGVTTAPYSFKEFELGTIVFMIIILAAIAIIFYYFKEVRPINKGPTNVLEPYIKKHLKKRENPADIKNKLLKAGWKQEEIKKAFLEAMKK